MRATMLGIIKKNKKRSGYLTDFLYNDGKGSKGVREDITLEECIKALKIIERDGYDDFELISRGGVDRDDYTRVVGKIKNQKVRCRSCKFGWNTRFEGSDSLCPRCKSKDVKITKTEYGSAEVMFETGDETINSIREYEHGTLEDDINKDYQEWLEWQLNRIEGGRWRYDNIWDD